MSSMRVPPERSLWRWRKRSQLPLLKYMPNMLEKTAKSLPVCRYARPRPATHSLRWWTSAAGAGPWGDPPAGSGSRQIGQPGATLLPLSSTSIASTASHCSFAGSERNHRCVLACCASLCRSMPLAASRASSACTLMGWADVITLEACCARRSTKSSHTGRPVSPDHVPRVLLGHGNLIKVHFIMAYGL
eukprot:5205196-Prymnesium_polylepis.1